MAYTKVVDDFAEVMTVADYIDSVKCGGFIDEDGFGYPIKDNKANTDIWLYPSELSKLPEDATHVAWYNK